MTSFSDEYLGQLAAFAARHAVPRVRALHLPQVQSVPDEQGRFCAVELEDGSVGLSYVLLDDALAHLGKPIDTRQFAGAGAMEVAGRYGSKAGLERAIGFAAANAMTRCLFDRAGFRPDFCVDSIGGVDPRPDDHIGMIGFFKPLLARIIERGARLTVVELKSELVGEHPGYCVTLDPAQLADCNKIVSTSTLLLNDTLDRMLAYCRKATCFAMLGPSAGCLPDGLFARGVTLLGGSWITDARGLLAAIDTGESQNAFTRKFALSADSYPGWEALLARTPGK